MGTPDQATQREFFVLSFCSNSVSCAVHRVDRSRDVEEGEIGKPQKFIDLVGSKNDGPDKQANS